jgi:leader peptidase (prepilin peptidase)/N-methyltransferase
MTLPPAELLLSPWCLALLGLCVGSFLNVVIHRLPQAMDRQWKLECAEALGLPPVDLPEPVTLSKPRSRCPSCGHPIAWHENIPVLSYLRLRGRCSACKTRISLRYPLVEVLTAALFGAIGWHFGAQPASLMWCGVAATLVALAGIDWDTTLLPDDLNQPLLWAGLAASALGWTLPLTTSLWGAVAGYLSLWTVYWFFKMATGDGSPHRPWQWDYWTTRAASGKEGMGHGDFKLLAALGAWLGWQMLLPIVLGASVIGAVVGIGMKLSSSLREGLYVPFGPFLAGSGLVVMIAGSERVMDWFGWV